MSSQKFTADPVLESNPMATFDTHTVTGSPLADIFDDQDDHSSAPAILTSSALCLCGAQSPAACRCSASSHANIAPRGRESTTKNLLTQPSSQRLTLKLTLPPAFKPRKSSDLLTNRLPTPPIDTLVPDPQQPPKRKRGRPRKIDSQRALNTNAAASRHVPSALAGPHAKLTQSRTLTKTGTARVKRGPANGGVRRRRSSSNFSDTVPRKHKHTSAATITGRSDQRHQPPQYPLFVPASILSADDLSSSSVSLSESSESDDEEIDSELTTLSMSDEQLDRGRTNHGQHSYDQQAQLERARVRRELLGHDTPQSSHQQQHTRQHHARAPHGQAAPKTNGASADSDTENDEHSASGNGDSDSDDGTDSDDADPNLTTTRPLPPAAVIEVDSDDEDTESEVDAELFFSNLLRSASSSDDEDEGDEVMLDIEVGVEIPGADGALPNEHEPEDGEVQMQYQSSLSDPALMVREGWDGALVFATDIETHGRGGVLDAAFERSSSWSRERTSSVPSRPPTAPRARMRSSTTSSLPLDVIAELQAAAESTLPMLPTPMDSSSALSDTEGGGETDGGETTDDELPFRSVPGLGLGVIVPPTPPVLGVRPDVTLSPSVHKSLRTSFIGDSPRPADLIQRQMQRKIRGWAEGSSPNDAGPSSKARSASISIPLHNSTNSLRDDGVGSSMQQEQPEKSRQPPLPKMGVFGTNTNGPAAHGLTLSTNSKSSAVIGKDATKGSVPSPFVRFPRRAAPGSSIDGLSTAASSPVRGLKRRASSDLAPFFNKRSVRFPPAGVDMFSSFPPPHLYAPDLFPSSPGSLFESGSGMLPESSPENSAIELDDVLCASVLSDETAATSLGGDISESINGVDGEGSQLSRWDRVPVGLYRRTRTSAGAEEMFSFGIGGFEYGDPSGDHQHPHHHHHSIAGPSTGLTRAQHRPTISLDSALWGLNSSQGLDFFDHEFEEMLSAGILASPMPFAGDLERATTPTPAQYVPETKSRKERRKEKKREKMRAAAAASGTSVKHESPEPQTENATSIVDDSEASV